jgi:tRNA-2-methylthio-N6-dimethylallyladenosine synthase
VSAILFEYFDTVCLSFCTDKYLFYGIVAVDAYGRDMIPKRKFSDLLRTVGAVPGLERLRFVTSHPRYMSLGVVDAVAETPTACEYFHIPFQSGSNDILKAMGRG